MEISANQIEVLFQKKIQAYQDLVEIYTQERKSLEKADVESLWAFSDKKQSMATQIAEIRLKILNQMNEAGIGHEMNATTFHIPKIISLMPEKLGRKLQKSHVSLITIKNTVHSLSEENKRFVEDYLGILDELIGIITNAGKPEPTYDSNSFCKNKKSNNLLLHREV